MKTLFAVSLVAAVSALSEAEVKFFSYISEYGKKYSTTEEFAFRLE